MKKVILTILISVTVLLGFSQGNDYIKVMKENIEAINNAEELADMQQLANKFERIADAEKKRWLPYYWSAYCNTLMVFMGMEVDDIDAQLDKAEEMLDKARDLQKSNDEVEVLQGLILQGRIQVDPQTRGYQYSVESTTAFNNAKSINPDNPRTYYLIGQNLLYTPEQFGGGTTAACPLFNTAAEKFASFKPESEISPDWGQKYNERLLHQCNP